MRAMPQLTQLVKEVVKAGDGQQFPRQGDNLTMHYTGTLIANGKKFDSSVDKNRPFKFKIGLGMVRARLSLTRLPWPD